MIVTYNNGFAEHRIEAPDGCKVQSDDSGIDFVSYPTPRTLPRLLWLWDELLMEAARSGVFGLRLVSTQPLN